MHFCYWSGLYTRYEKQTNLKSFCPLLRRILVNVTLLKLKKNKNAYCPKRYIIFVAIIQ